MKKIDTQNRLDGNLITLIINENQYKKLKSVR